MGGGPSINYTVASSWYFTLFHDEDAQSNKPKVKVKVNFSLEQTKKAQRGCRGIGLLFL